MTATAEQTPVDTTTDRPWRRALRASALLWVISHIGYGVLFTIAFWSGARVPALRNALAPWHHWDSTWFVRIATDGYTDGDCDTPGCRYAFFPLYPMLIRIVNFVLPGGALPAALIVSSAAMLGALAVLYRLVETEFGREVAERTTWYLLAFPPAFFLAIGYNESLFLLLCVSTMYFLRRGNWLAAGALGGLAAATRSVGLLLLVPFCYEYVRQRGWRPRPAALAGLLIPAGLGGYMLYTWARVGDPLAFSHAQRQWGRKLDWPWVSFFQTFRNLARTDPVLAPNGAHLILELGVVLLMITLLVLAFVGPWRMSRDQWALPVFGAALTLAMISFPSFLPQSPFPLMSSPRLALEVFPAFIVLARIGANQGLDRLYLFCALALQGAAVVHFLNGGWVA